MLICVFILVRCSSRLNVKMFHSTFSYFVLASVLCLPYNLRATDSSIGARNLFHQFVIDEEPRLIEALWKYSESEEIRLAHLQRLRDTFTRNIERYASDDELASNPLAILKSIKHLTIDFEDAKKLMKTGHEDSVRRVLKKGDSVLSSRDHLHTEVRDLIDFQRAYNVTVRDIMEGRLVPNSAGETSLTTEDCSLILRTLTENHYHEATVAWLEECQERFDNTTRLEALKTSIFSSLLTGDKLKSRGMVNRYLRAHGRGNRVLSDLGMRLSMQLGDARTKLSGFKDKYEWKGFKACAGDYDGALALKGYLKCRYNHHNSPFLVIAPLEEEMISLDPKVSVFREAIYESEIELLKLDSQGKFQVSRIKDRNGMSFANVQVRNSESHNVNNTEPKYAKLWYRLQDLSSLSLVKSEFFQMIHYGPGGYFRVHSDYIGNRTQEAADINVRGNRVATALLCLNTIKFGGHTVFPRLKVSVEPVQGSILFWMNMREDMSQDEDTFRAGCPVIYGEKLVCTEWIRMKSQTHWIAEPEDDERANYSRVSDSNVMCHVRE